MAWNPETYNKFKSERFTPFNDLAALIKVKSNMEVLDLGCGTGELTRKLADLLPGSTVLGIDSSIEMLNQSKAFENSTVKFECKTIEEQLQMDKKWDLVFSNAAIQWVNNHKILIPKIISIIKPKGQLAIQIPSQHHNISNIILNDLAKNEPFKTHLQNWNRTPAVLDIDEYAELLFENGGQSITVYEKVYPLVLENSLALFDWVSGSALIPYLEKLPVKVAELFMGEYKIRLSNYFKKSPLFYPFKRIIIEATF